MSADTLHDLALAALIVIGAVCVVGGWIADYQRPEYTVKLRRGDELRTVTLRADTPEQARRKARRRAFYDRAAGVVIDELVEVEERPARGFVEHPSRTLDRAAPAAEHGGSNPTRPGTAAGEEGLDGHHE